jgi:hypothetical protein
MDLLAYASITVAEADAQVVAYRAAGWWPLNVNFFCHVPPSEDAAVMTAWRERLAGYYDELGLPRDTPVAGGGRKPFDDACVVRVARACASRGREQAPAHAGWASASGLGGSGGVARGARGTTTVNVVPSSSVEVRSSVPPWASTTCFAM